MSGRDIIFSKLIIEMQFSIHDKLGIFEEENERFVPRNVSMKTFELLPRYALNLIR
jgi:hypothetical protein